MSRSRAAFAGPVHSNPAWQSCLKTMQHLAADSVGPRGFPQVIRPNEDAAPVLTSISHRLFDQLNIDHPAARAMLQMLQARQAKGADGGLLTVYLASTLTLAATDRAMPSRLVAALLPSVLNRCLSSVLDDVDHDGHDPVAIPLRMSDLPSLIALVRTVLLPKHLAVPQSAHPDAAEKLNLLIVTAFVRSLPDGDSAALGDMGAAAEARVTQSAAAARAALNTPGVRPLAVTDASLEDSEIIDGVLLDTIFPEFAPELETMFPEESGEDLLVALYDTSLEATKPEGLDAKITVTDWRDFVYVDEEDDEEVDEDERRGRWHLREQRFRSTPLSEEGLLLKRFADGVAATGVKVLCCQQRVAPALEFLLIDRGILPLPRLSIRHIGAVRRLTGAMPLSLLQPPRTVDLGRLGTVRRRKIGQKVYTHLVPPLHAVPPSLVEAAAAADVRVRPSQPVVTLVLGAVDPAASEELSAAAACALGTLGAALSQRRPRLVPGGGCFELLLAARLRREAALPGEPEKEGPRGDKSHAKPPPRGEAAGDGSRIVCHGKAGGMGDKGNVASGEVGAETLGSDAAEFRRRVMARLRRATCELLADALEDFVAELTTSHSDKLRGREAVEELSQANAIAATKSYQKARGGRRSFYGWASHDDEPCEVLVTKRERGADAKEDSSSSSSSSSDDDGGDEEDGWDRRRASRAARRLGPSRIEWAGAVELESEKVEAILGAVEIACSIMGVDEVVVDTR